MGSEREGEWMIEIDFDYIQPKEPEEAIAAFQTGKHSSYYSGGTECISRMRVNEISPDVVVDISHIEACHVYKKKDNVITIGAAIPLNSLIDEPLFPLLKNVSHSIATRTARNKITVGGNICSHLPYKEALLPFLLADSKMLVATANGVEQRSIFQWKELKKEELLLQIMTDESFVKKDFIHMKKTRQSSVNYPILTVASMEVDGEMRVAFSGLTKEPFRSVEIENLIEKEGENPKTCVQSILEVLPKDILNDYQASKEYRLFTFQHAIKQLLNGKEEQDCDK